MAMHPPPASGSSPGEVTIPFGAVGFGGLSFGLGFHSPGELLREHPPREMSQEEVLRHLGRIVDFASEPRSVSGGPLREALLTIGPLTNWERLGPLTPAHIEVAAEALQPNPPPEWVNRYLARETTDADDERVFVADAVGPDEAVERVIESGEFNEFSRLLAADLRFAFGGQEVFVGIKTLGDIADLEKADDGE